MFISSLMITLRYFLRKTEQQDKIILWYLKVDKKDLGSDSHLI